MARRIAAGCCAPTESIRETHSPVFVCSLLFVCLQLRQQMEEQWGIGSPQIAVGRVLVAFKQESSAGSAVLREWFGIVSLPKPLSPTFTHTRSRPPPCPRKPFPCSLSVVVVPVVHVAVLDGAPVRAEGTLRRDRRTVPCRAVPAQVSSALCEPAANVLVSYDGRKTLRPSPSASLVRGPTRTNRAVSPSAQPTLDRPR
jgi:hypothetical protein